MEEMSRVKKKRGRKLPVIIVILALLIAAAAGWVFHSCTVAGGKLVSRSAAKVEQGGGVVNVDALLRLKAPDIIDLRGCDVSAEDYKTLHSAFPDCQICWDVPLGGVGEVYDFESESVKVPVYHPDKAELYALMPNLREIDLRDALMSVEDYEGLRAAVPECVILWNVPVSEALELENDVSAVSVADAAEAEKLIAHSGYLEAIESISLGFSPEMGDIEALAAAFPDADIDYSLTVAGRSVHRDDTWVDLSAAESGETEDIIAALALLPKLEEAELMNADGESPFTLEAAAALAEAYPELKLSYSFELFGQRVSTDMERLEYFSVDIGDGGLERFRTALPIMHSLSYLRLDDCGTTDEEMARLRDDFPEVKVVWRVFMGQFSCPTDTLKIWATYSLTNETAAKLKYCTDVRYMDLGHNEQLSDVSFLAYMPDLEAAILALTAIEDIEPIRNCKKLNFLELFTTEIKDISPLEDLVNLEYLNISNIEINDITPIFGLKNLKQVNCLMMGDIPEEQIAQFQELHPDIFSIFYPYSDPTEYNWRRYADGTMTPRYALLTKQIGYDSNDMSVYPRGYVTEEITMEDVPVEWYT